MRDTLHVIAVILFAGFFLVDLGRAESADTDISVMTFNVLHGGTRRGQPLPQTAKVIGDAKADVVGLQEIGKNAEKLADLLGWNHVSHGGAAILTRFEIVEGFKSGIRIKLDSDQEVCVFNVHLSPAPYQPYQLLEIPYGNAPFIETEEEAIASARTTRGKQIESLLKEIKLIEDAGLPVFVTGDFNEPSHLDWTEAAAKSGRHPIKVSYPGSMMMVEAGFSDAWRVVYPDEMKKPGFTWTPLTKEDDPKDHHDRIDFVYSKGENVEVKGARVVGEDDENADIVVSPYPSDHRAVVASFVIRKRGAAEAEAEMPKGEKSDS